MSDIVYPLASSTWGQEEISAINQVIASDMYTMGSKVKQFEEEYAQHFGHGHAVMCNSGSSANLLMLSLLKLKYKISGDIIVPAVGWSTSYFPVNQNGFKLNFVDVDPFTFNIDTNKIESAITPNTSAIMAINLLGNPCDFDAIYKIADKHNLFVIEDNCESMGAKYNNKFTGSHGIIGTQSFFFSHHLQTMEGGMVTVDNPEDADWLRSLRAHGWCRDLSDTNPLFKKTGGWKDNFTFVTPGYTVRPLEMSGAVGLEQLKKWQHIMSCRIQNKNYFFEIFGDEKYFKLQKTLGESSWFSFGCICTGPLKGRRDELVSAFTKAGIQSRPLASGNWLRQPVMNMLDYIDNGDYSGADEIEDEGFFVGNGMQDIRAGIDAMHKVVEKLV